MVLSLRSRDLKYTLRDDFGGRGINELGSFIGGTESQDPLPGQAAGFLDKMRASAVITLAAALLDASQAIVLQGAASPAMPTD